MADGFNHESTSCIICPHCGYVHRDSWEFLTRGKEAGDADCHACDQPFRWSVHITHAYTTKKLAKEPHQ